MPSLAPPRLPRPLVAAFVAYVVLLSVAAVVQLRAEPVAPRSQDRPNIVLVTTDDQRLDEMQFLPNAQRLLGEAGLTFENALTPHPLCCPARAELMTGQLAQNNGVRGNFPPQGGYDAFDNQQHIGVWLQEAGYSTAFLGKMLNGYSKNDGRDPGWDIFDATSHGFADYYDFVQYDEDGPVQVEGYYTDYVGEKAVEYVDRLAGSDDPFFLWVSHFAPHPARERDTCKSETCGLVPPRPSPAQREEQRRTGELPHQAEADALARSIIDSPSFNEADVSDKQALVRRQGSFSEGKVVRSARGRAAALDALDQTLEPLVEQLRAEGELDNTYIVLVTDNGFQMGEHRWFGKILPYEESVRTPLLVRGPGIGPGTTTDATATIVDLVPTFLDIAGAEAGVEVDGRSLLDLWRGEETEDLHPGGVLVQGGPFRPETPDTGWLYRGIRTDRYTWVRFHDGFVEMYDRDRDPHQVESVTGRPRYAAVEAELERRAEVLAACAGAEACNQDFGPLPEP
ncbi:Choline-sulfatase [Nocardioides dokdonensis FR1436]|uniref:Choline-sulfatase n=1 Tax=Nocardioides dokdonensis FR1436 TaxID=1300347 RepID=A0A1A9GGU1_9ACTN|nr:sulfatase [Nocardioides dokdonensis]ANH37517.1 Choline-sulfatase [Nocardioides dokdonensis FR1436]